MKNLKQIMLLVMTVTMVSITSCSKDDDGGGVVNAAGGTITAKVNGNQFTTLEITSFATKVTAGGASSLVIQGNTATQAVNVQISGYEGVGTYEIKDTNVFSLASYGEPNANDPLNMPTWYAPFENSGVIGQLKVSEDANGRVKGTFNFKGKNVDDGSFREITEGSFDLSITVY